MTLKTKGEINRVFEKVKKVLTRMIWKTLPTCKDVTAMVSHSLDTELSNREKIRLKLHLWGCVSCARYFSQIKFLGKVFALQNEDLKNGKTGPVLNSGAAERLKNALKASKFL